LIIIFDLHKESYLSHNEWPILLADYSPMAKPSKPETLDFEAALAELNDLVERMEQGKLSLEESLNCFERGISLVRHCQTALQAAEQKVQILTEKNGAITLTPFQTNDLA
jgi:exodeoxyribonuclease VII small subunit